jgi:hypothetical protein
MLNDKPTREELTSHRLRDLLAYDPETGLFRWLVSKGSNAPAGVVTGVRANSKVGYVYIGIDGVRYLAHRLAWLYVYGVWPSQMVDHINRVRTDNRIANLREADCSLNAQNAVRPRAGKQLPIGVFRHGGRFVAKITVLYQNYNLGSFRTPAEAQAAYQRAKEEFHAGAVL